MDYHVIDSFTDHVFGDGLAPVPAAGAEAGAKRKGKAVLCLKGDIRVD